MALGSTQPLTEMSTRSIFCGGKGGRCVRLTTYRHPVPLSRNLGTLTSWNPLGLSRAVMGLIYLYHHPSKGEAFGLFRPKTLFSWTPQKLTGHSDEPYE